MQENSTHKVYEVRWGRVCSYNARSYAEACEVIAQHSQPATITLHEYRPLPAMPCPRPACDDKRAAYHSTALETAAPDLLSALQGLLCLVNDFIDQPGWTEPDSMIPALESAWKARDKAEGKQS